jgi:hypothetical protein
MTSPFLKPRFVGGRFDRHGFPLDVLKDFAAFEQLLIEVAKREYLADNQHRKRSPRGFSAQFDLQLIGVEAGSAVAIIALVFSGLFEPSETLYLERARDQVIATIASASDGKAPLLSQDLLRYFDGFGRSLRAGEQVWFEQKDLPPACFDPEVRQKLLRASMAEEWSEEAALKGRVSALDVADGTFELQLKDGVKLKAPLPQFRADLLLALADYEKKRQVSVKGVIGRDRSNRLKAFSEIEEVTLLDPLDVETRLEELAELKDGWLDGHGKALDAESLRELSEAFDRHYDQRLALPHLYPTAEGNIQAEWTLPTGWEVSVEIALSSGQAEFQAVNADQLVEHVWRLAADGEGWAQLNSTMLGLV